VNVNATITITGPDPSANTVSANTNSEGIFLFKGLNAGTYTVTAVPAAGSPATCVSKTVITTISDGVVTNLPISLQ
jgi:hypothetical protein